MPIRWDSLLARHVARELDAELTGSRLRAIRLDGSSRDVYLLFRERTLVWRLHPERGFFLHRGVAEPGEADQKLRARVRSVRAPADERVIVFELAGERPGSGPYELIVELLGNQLNAVMTEGGERRIRHLLKRREGKRPMNVGLVYPPLPAREREGRDEVVTRDRWMELIEAVPPPARPTELLKQIAWVSPLNAKTFLGRSEDGPDDLEAGWRLWSEWTAAEAAAAPVVVERSSGAQPYPFPLTAKDVSVDSLARAFEVSATSDASPDIEPVLGLPPELVRRLEDYIASIERKRIRLQAQLDDRDDPDRMRALGDLILARYAEIEAARSQLDQKGVVELHGFDGEVVEVALDPALAPHENADAYYDRAGRSERAAEQLPELISAATREGTTLAELLAQARQGDVDADEIRKVLPVRPTRSQQSDAPALPYRTFRSSGGLEIRVGRGARHNDDLTFRHSAPNDVWLHARHAAGAHVVLRWQGPGNPPARDLEEAGVLAALHSKARTSGSVPVDWTLRKYVRKPRGSAPGSVVPDRVRTVFVTPDEEVLGRLREDSAGEP